MLTHQQLLAYGSQNSFFVWALGSASLQQKKDLAAAEHSRGVLQGHLELDKGQGAAQSLQGSQHRKPQWIPGSMGLIK